MSNATTIQVASLLSKYSKCGWNYSQFAAVYLYSVAWAIFKLHFCKHAPYRGAHLTGAKFRKCSIHFEKFCTLLHVCGIKTTFIISCGVPLKLRSSLWLLKHVTVTDNGYMSEMSVEWNAMQFLVLSTGVCRFFSDYFWS